MTTRGWESGSLSQLLAPARVTAAPVDSQPALPGPQFCLSVKQVEELVTEYCEKR